MATATPARRTRSRAVQPDVEVAETKVMVTTSLNKDDPQEREEVIEVHQFVTTPAQVKVSAGMTLSIAKFEFLRVDVAVTMPCYKEEVEQAIPLVADIVAAHLTTEIENYQNQQG